VSNIRYALSFGLKRGRRLRKLQILVILTMLFAAALNAIFVLYLKAFIDSIAEIQGFQLSLLYAFLIMAALNMGMVASWFLIDCTLGILKKKAQTRLLIEMYHRLVECPQRELDRNTPGEYMSKILSDTAFVGSIIGAFIPALAMNIIQFLANILTAGLLNPFLTFIICLATPFYYILYSRQAESMISSAAEERKSFSRLTESLRVKVEAIRNIKNLNIGKNVLNLFENDSESWYEKIRRVVLTEKKYAFSFNFLRNVIPLAVLGIGVYLATVGSISIGTIVAFFYFSLTFFNPLTVLSTDLGSLAQAVSPIQRVQSILSLPQESSGEKILDTISEISFRNVSFSYDHKLALDQVTLPIRKGEKIAVVGESGSGKTTLFSMMNRLYDPSEGEIFIDGEQAQKFTIESLRKKIITVTSRDIIFLATIRENVTLGDNYSKEDVAWAASMANITEDFGSLEEIIGPGARDVSDGQRQRICLARTILRRPHVLLMDEVLSAVDSRLEEKIMANLLREFSEKTIIVISHRLSTILSMDRILVMKNGNIIAEGSFEGLNRSCTEFTSLMKKQIVK